MAMTDWTEVPPCTKGSTAPWLAASRAQWSSLGEGPLTTRCLSADPRYRGALPCSGPPEARLRLFPQHLLSQGLVLRDEPPTLSNRPNYALNSAVWASSSVMGLMKAACVIPLWCVRVPHLHSIASIIAWRNIINHSASSPASFSHALRHHFPSFAPPPPQSPSS